MMMFRLPAFLWTALTAAVLVAAVVAVGALLSRADAVEAVARYAPAHADAG